MTPDRLQAVAPFIAAGLFVLALLVFASSLRYFRKSRTDFYWRRRRMAGQRGWRLFVWSIVLTLFSGLLCLVTGVAGLVNIRLTPTTVSLAASGPPTITLQVAPALLSLTPHITDTAVKTQSATNAVIKSTELRSTDTRTASVTATATVTASMSVTPTRTSSALTSPSKTLVPSATLRSASVASATPKATASSVPSSTATSSATSSATNTETSTATLTLSPTQTPTFAPSTTPTPTPTVTPSETLIPAPLTRIPLQSSVTPGPDARLKITALDTQISANFTPITPGDTFTAGFKRIYFFVNFSGMQSGVLWRRQVIHDGNIIEDTAYLWGLAQSGNAYFFFGEENGFQPGSYQIRLFIGESDTPATEAAFTVK